MSEFTARTETLIGKDKVDALKNKHVAVFGLGGVGGNLCEALVRAGIGAITLVDGDCIDITNLNRQLFATVDNIGERKVEAAKKRLLSINPNLDVITKDLFYLPENSSAIDVNDYDYIADAIDTVTAKLFLIEEAKRNSIPIISAMGAGNKLDPTRFEVSDIYKTSVCPLAKIMRKELKNRGIKSLKVVYSKEEAITNSRPPGSISFVPPVMGMIMAGEIIKDLIS